MQKLQKYIPYVYLFVLFALLAFQLNSVQQFTFFYREQQQILLWDWDWFVDRYAGVSGVAMFLAHFITQVFYIPWVGAVITALLSVLAIYCLAVSIQPLTQSKLYSFSLASIPVGLELSNIADYCYHYQGFICLLLLSVFAALYAKTALRLAWKLRLLLSLVYTLVLFYFTGPLCLPFTIYIFLVELCLKKENWYYMGVPIVIAALSLFYAERWCWLTSMSTAFTQDLFYYYLFKIPESCVYSWIALMVYPFVTWFFSKFSPRGAAFNVSLSFVVFLGISGFTYYQSEKDKEHNEPLIELQHYLTVGDWDAILRSPYAQVKNYLYMNHVNLALSHKGQLIKHFFDYQQNDPQTIQVSREMNDNDRMLTFLFAYIHYQMGDMGAAQNHAHDTFQLTTYGQPAMLQMLIKTNLIKGGMAYKVAEKYITLLEKSWRYADWATDMRKYLYNDAAVMADADLSRMRKNLPDNNTFTMDPEECLYQILLTNPEDKIARDYLIAYQFVYRDVDFINRMVETFHNTPVLNPFPEELQEAYLIVNDLNFDYCQEHGVSEETVQRYKKFLTVYNLAAQRGKNPQQAVRQEFGNSTFYNFMYK